MGKEMEEKILESLKQYGRMATFRISAICGVSHGAGLEVLNKMHVEGKIRKIIETHSIQWELLNDVGTKNEK